MPKWGGRNSLGDDDMVAVYVSTVPDWGAAQRAPLS